jgi:hypothetical protein
MHDRRIERGPNCCQSIDGNLSTRWCVWIVLDVARIDVSGEGETDILLNPELVDEFVPDLCLLFFAGWFWWAVGFAGDEREERENKWEEIDKSHGVWL